MWETWIQSLGWEDPLEKGKATHLSILAWRIPWTVAGQAPLCMEFSGILPESTQNIGLGSHSLLQRLFLSQGLSPGLSYCRQIFTILPPGKPKNTGVGHLSLLWQIFLTQESNQILLHCRRILYQLSYQGCPLKTN